MTLFTRSSGQIPRDVPIRDTTISIYTRAILDLSNYRNAKGNNATIYLEADYGITADLHRDKIDKYNVVLITWENQKEIYIRNNNHLTHTKIFPAEIKKGNIVITITPYAGARKGKHYTLSVGDGYNVIYEFNCETKRYDLLRVEEWGI